MVKYACIPLDLDCMNFFVRKRINILYVLCHGTRGKLLIEGLNGIGKFLLSNDIHAVINKSVIKNIKLAIMPVCNSSTIRQEFLQGGIRSVISVNSNKQLTDKIGSLFASTVINLIFDGHNLKTVMKNLPNRMKLKIANAKKDISREKSTLKLETDYFEMKHSSNENQYNILVQSKSGAQDVKLRDVTASCDHIYPCHMLFDAVETDSSDTFFSKCSHLKETFLKILNDIDPQTYPKNKNEY